MLLRGSSYCSDAMHMWCVHVAENVEYFELWAPISFSLHFTANLASSFKSPRVLTLSSMQSLPTIDTESKPGQQIAVYQLKDESR